MVLGEEFGFGYEEKGLGLGLVGGKGVVYEFVGEDLGLWRL